LGKDVPGEVTPIITEIEDAIGRQHPSQSHRPDRDAAEACGLVSASIRGTR
jgi:hypothetical protein